MASLGRRKAYRFVPIIFLALSACSSLPEDGKAEVLPSDTTRGIYVSVAAVEKCLEEKPGILVDAVTGDVEFSEEALCEEKERIFYYPDQSGEMEETALESISWDVDDSTFRPDGTTIHFQFSDGKSEDKHIFGFARSVEYLDFTGDGKQEIIVYSYFVNTATEYTLIDIFQVDHGQIKGVTPEADIAEFADELWSMSLAEVQEDGEICHGLELESIDKISGLAYLNKYMLVIYKNGKWELREVQEYEFDESWLEQE